MASAVASEETDEKSTGIPKEAIQLAPAPSHVHYSSPACMPMTCDGFYLATSSDQSKDFRGINKYCFSSDSWVSWMPYPAEYKIDGMMGCFDQNQNIFHLFGKSKRIFTFDLNNRESTSERVESLSIHEGDEIAFHVVLVHDEIYVFSRGFSDDEDVKTKGAVWNRKSKEIRCQQAMEKNCIEFIAFVVYLQSEHSLLIVSIKELYDEVDDDERYAVIFWYWSLANNTISRRGSFICNLSNVTCARMVGAERYMILLGMSEFYGSLGGDYIFVLDRTEDEYTFHKCNIDISNSIHHMAISYSGTMTENVVSGYIRRMYSFSIPMDVIEMICFWCRNEIMHFIEFNTNDQPRKHFAITVDDILSNLSAPIQPGHTPSASAE